MLTNSFVKMDSIQWYNSAVAQTLYAFGSLIAALPAFLAKRKKKREITKTRAMHKNKE